MENYDYKDEIVQSRTGNLGSSDSKMLKQIAELGFVPNSALKRLAVVKGFRENDTFSNPAMRFGDFIENQIFASLKAQDERWQSNPCFISKKYSRKNVGCLTHVDAVLQDDEKQVLSLVEVKATKTDFTQTRDEYKFQLLHHYLLGQEFAARLGNYKVRILLAHYCTDGVDLDEPFEFDPQRLTVKQLRDVNRLSYSYDLSKAMDIVSEFLETFDAYYEDEEIDADMLPSDVKKQFDMVTTLLSEIKTREEQVNAFKTKLYDFMVSKNMRCIKNDEWNIVRVAPCEATSFDYKTFLEDFAKEHPRKAEKIKAKYAKTTSKKGYVTIKLKK